MKTLSAWMAPFSAGRPTPCWRERRTVEDGEPMRLVCPTPIAVTCVSGTAWITTGADTRDVVLETGQQHVAARGDRLFINGMPRCVLHFETRSPCA